MAKESEFLDLIDVGDGALTSRGELALAVMRKRNGETTHANGAERMSAVNCDSCWSEALAQARKDAGSIKPFDMAAAKRFLPMAKLSVAILDIDSEIRNGSDDLALAYNARFYGRRRERSA